MNLICNYDFDVNSRKEGGDQSPSVNMALTMSMLGMDVCPYRKSRLWIEPSDTFFFFLFVNFFYQFQGTNLIEPTCSKESKVTNKGQRD